MCCVFFGRQESCDRIRRPHHQGLECRRAVQTCGKHCVPEAVQEAACGSMLYTIQVIQSCTSWCSNMERCCDIQDSAAMPIALESHPCCGSLTYHLTASRQHNVLRSVQEDPKCLATTLQDQVHSLGSVKLPLSVMDSLDLSRERSHAALLPAGPPDKVLYSDRLRSRRGNRSVIRPVSALS